MRRMPFFIFLFASLLFFSCKNDIDPKVGNSINSNILREMDSLKTDSLRKEGYIFSKKIDFFNMTNDNEKFEYGNFFYAVRKNDKNDNVSIQEFRMGSVNSRIIKKKNSFFYEKLEENFTGDESELSTFFIFYSKQTIVIYDIERNYFENDKKRYLSDVIFIYKNKIRFLNEDNKNNVLIDSIPLTKNVFDEKWCIKNFFYEKNNFKIEELNYSKELPSFYCDYILKLERR